MLDRRRKDVDWYAADENGRPYFEMSGGCFQAPGTWRWVDVPRGLECVVCGSGFCAPADIKRAFTRAGYVAAWVDEEMARRKQFHTAEKERER